MRVCIFNRSYWPDTGATGQLLTELAEDLVAHHGWDVTVVTGVPVRHQGAVLPAETRHGVRILRAAGTRFDPRRFAGRAANYVSYFLSAAMAAVRLPPCDVVLAMTDPPIIGLAALITAWRHRVPFVYLTQDVFPEVAVLVEDFRSGTADRLLDRVNRFLLRRADRVVVLGESMKAKLVAGKGADPSKMDVIHNWADARLLTPGPRENAFRAAHGLQGAFVVMHAGNIGLSQNLDIVLDAAERLRDLPDVRFVFVGDGARRVALEEAARARSLVNVRFVPYQPREAMADSYAAADVFLVSLRPGLSGFIVPSKVYSILAVGRGYVAAIEPDSEAARIAMEHGCGVAVEPTGAAVAAAVAALVRDPARVEVMGERARAASALFDRPRQVARYAGVLRDAAGRR